MLYSANANFVSSSLNGEEMLLDTKTGQYFGLNETAKLIWDSLRENKQTISQLVNLICDAYDAEPDLVLKDVQEVLLQMVESKSISATAD